MILTAFSYRDSDGWVLDNLSPLTDVNLLVGRNATGKTRTIEAIQNVTSFMQMKTFLRGNQSFYVEMEYDMYDVSHTKMEYAFKVENGKIEREQLTVGGRLLIDRQGDFTRYEGNVINPPVDKLVVQIRRDKEEFPEIEQLMSWADGITCVSCSNINPYTILGAQVNFINPYPFSELVEALNAESKKHVLENACALGYDIADIKVFKATADLNFVQVKERDVKKRLIDISLSSGMLRTLYILCFLERIRFTEHSTLLLIDDLGEGLDYHRATQLGKMVFDYCSNSNVQLVASSNDAFLMDVVDIAKWQILQRNGSSVTTLNQSRNYDMFRSFRMTGLSNFDLFSSDFIEQYLKIRK